jgi:predicted RNA binding protein YcfA (HicA-like mRNA interferase family)
VAVQRPRPNVGKGTRETDGGNMTTPAVSAIADALVAALKTAGFTEAARRGVHYAKREEAETRKCTVVATNGVYDAGSRRGFDEVYELAVIVQKACSADDNATLDALLLNVQTLVRLWSDGGALRHAKLAGAEYDSGPEHLAGNIYDHSQLREEHLFTSLVVVRYGVNS